MAALAAARANAGAVKQDIERVDAESQGLGSLRESLRLVSPVDGVIVSREAEPGTTVVAGQAVLRLVVPDAMRAFVLTLVICALASVLAIRAALRIDPADAIGG